MNLDYVTSRIKSYNRLLMIKYLIRNVKSYVHYPNKKIVYLSMQLLFQFLIVRGIKEKRESSRTLTNEKKENLLYLQFSKCLIIQHMTVHEKCKTGRIK
jgi:hypothetical protein